MKKRLFYFFLILFNLWSCGIKTRFSDHELKWINVYNEGDTLIFKSTTGELDTSFIIKKEIFYPKYNPVENHGKYLPQWGIVWYKNKNLKYHPDGYRMITMIKKRPNDETFLNIDYLYSDVLVTDIASNNLDKLKKDKVYEFDTYHENAKPEQPKMIYWNEDYGIIKYITHSNEIWERINLPK